MSEFLFRFREPLSAAGSAIVVLLLLFHSLAPSLKHSATSSAPIELTFNMPEVQTSPEQQVEPQLKTIQAIPRNISQVVDTPKEPITTSDTKAAPADQVIQTEAASSMSGLASSPVQGVPDQTMPSLANQLAVSSADSGRVDSGRNAEAIYASKVHAYLQSVKRYPTGREASLQRPTGVSVIWFMVRRNGALVETGIETSSGSMLLDNAALATVRRSIYPIFPDEVWPNKVQQRFTVELDFIPAH